MGAQGWKAIATRHLRALAASLPMVIAIIGFLVVLKGEDWREQYIKIALLNGVYCLVIFHLVWHILGHKCPVFFGIPRVIEILRDDSILIVEKLPWLSIGVWTTIYVMENDFERLVCMGEVINVQYNDLVQIKIQVDNDGYSSKDAIWKMFERTEKKNLLVKPGAYRGST